MLILIAEVFQRYLALMFVRRLPLCMRMNVVVSSAINRSYLN